ncbi:MAG: ABC transporter permease subunit, partial [Mucispirillum sp.]|nr:ABC transporter permease subunit [Mucispirillum sp.]
DGSMVIKTSYTLYLILIGLLVSFLITALLVVLANLSYVLKDLMRTLISVLDPLPGIALLPIAILWFGIGKAAIVFIMIHSIVWPTLLSVMAGFDSIPKIYREVGQNIGLNKLQLIRDIYVPAAFPNILMGIKNGWARAWRSLIAAEMVFGTTGAIGGLGWDIYLKRSYLDMPGMIATLIVLMIIGILIEDLLFSTIEKHTVKKWGMVI